MSDWWASAKFEDDGGVVGAGAPRHYMVRVTVKSRRDLQDGRVVLLADKSANAADLHGLRGRSVDAVSFGQWRVKDIAAYGGLGEGESDEVGLVVEPLS